MRLKVVNLNLDLIQYYLILFFPISLILGNSAINTNLFLVTVVGLTSILKQKNILDFKNYSELILLGIFFFSSLLSGLLFSGEIIKPIAYLRFFLFVFVIVLFLNKNEDKINSIFLFYGLINLILIIDVIFQSYTSYNILGIKNEYNFNSSFYQDEKIAGGHIQTFSFFTIIFFKKIFPKQEILSNLFFTTALTLIPLSIYVSHNRMPLIIYLIGLIIFFIIKNFKTKLLISVSLITFLILAAYHPDKFLKTRFESFYGHSSNLYTKYIEGVKNKMYQDENDKRRRDWKYKGSRPYSGSGHASLYSTATVIWLENKFLGIGMKNFYEECRKKNSVLCSGHPHNFYFDILVATGLIGFVPFSFLVIILFKKTISFMRNATNNENYYRIKLCLLITFLMSFFPIKSSGSIYSTYAASSLFLILSFCIYFFNKK